MAIGLEEGDGPGVVPLLMSFNSCTYEDRNTLIEQSVAELK